MVWFTYRADGGSVWFVAPSGTWVAPETWEGSVYRTATGTYDMLRSNVYEPSSLQVKPVGSIRLRFAGDNATLEYTIDGNSGSNALQRQGF